VILEVQHETRFEYSENAIEAMTEVRMEPATDEEQSLHSFHLAVAPATETFRYQDGFGNRVHHFNLLSPHGAVRILAASIVETRRKKCESLGESAATWPIPSERFDLEALDFLQFRGSVRASARLDSVVAAVRPKSSKPVGRLVLEITDFVNRSFEYARDVTLASSPVDETLEKGKGVCQDFAHVMIAVLRSLSVPARYVSGYIHRPNKESQSHAWCEAWIPEIGWVGLDPTNNQVIDDRFVKVAIGRDFTDVPPNKGVCRTAGQESISVRVETRALDRLPSLSWQEQLPPLAVPLTAILSRAALAAESAAEIEQQQQQQQ
jgi:transglutaminase-like putative cysteine protease